MPQSLHLQMDACIIEVWDYKNNKYCKKNLAMTQIKMTKFIICKPYKVYGISRWKMKEIITKFLGKCLGRLMERVFYF